MDFPRYVFRCPGARKFRGGSNDSLLVADPDAYDAALSAGWYPTIGDALDALKGAPAPVHEPVSAGHDDNAPPTRAEMEQKARALGVGFNWKTTDAGLLAKISAAIGA